MSHGRSSELATLTDGRATAIYWCPPVVDGPREGHRGGLLLVASPGAKEPFIRVWLDDITVAGTGRIADRTWFIPHDAVRIA